jgi:hypothetical protein
MKLNNITFMLEQKISKQILSLVLSVGFTVQLRFSMSCHVQFEFNSGFQWSKLWLEVWLT